MKPIKLMGTSSYSFSTSTLSTNLPTNPTLYPFGPSRIHLPKNPLMVRSATNGNGHGYGYGWDYRGGLVDQSMLVLRKRIEDIRAADRIDPDPRDDWMGWEKNYYESCYGSDVCQACGLIQMFAMSLRPSVAFGLLGLTFLSVPVSLILLGFHLGQALRFLLN